jgi:DNA-3-methyladenine glycosylase I
MTRKTCAWSTSDPLMVAYHDEEWGVPVRDDQALFEKLLLDGFQAGLSWSTILRKREAYRKLYLGFDPEKVARFGPAKIESLMQDARIIRNRQKIEGSVKNARAFLALRNQGLSFSDFLWHFTGGVMKLNRWRSLKQLPAETAESRAMAKALRQRGFTFCGPTICYAFMQAIGMVNDHVVDCFRYAEVQRPTIKSGRLVHGSEYQ